ncbi:hypothetical protein KEM48_004275 [Puccinia striiformis f. sp. tritici PST-130]|uniref:Uncharacterized protein n=1 Tax=Puccinia striiformis f. sp. tritici PST-78 TaxID=1165861 RepID=A0A0L0V8V9_9BASI|nr:hypothetical protein KEM48_004275 [Puccinia striiformis f. sp. tritici PST-130]KNE95727.1 hypothetical protein PSTG_10944 [Puccinia striiformis f. sp. tritici PST-78]
MINSYLNLASHNQGSPDTIHSSQDKETSLEDGSPSSSESESLPCDGLSLLSSPAPTVIVPFKCIVSYSLQLEDRKRGQKPTWKPAKSPATTKMYINIDPNKQSFKEIKIAVADAAAAKSGTSHQAGNHDNSKEDDSDNEGLTIEDIDLFREEIHKRYSIDCHYNRIFPSFPHPIKINKYIPLSAEKIRIWATALLERKEGVLIDLPPSEFQYKVRQKASVAAAPAPAPAPPPEIIVMNAALTAFLQVAADDRAQLMANRTATHLAPFDPPGMNGNHTLKDYRPFIECVPPEARRVSGILRPNRFISYRSFASLNLNNEYLTAMELPLGLNVICLRDSVSGFFNHLNTNVV